MLCDKIDREIVIYIKSDKNLKERNCMLVAGNIAKKFAELFLELAKKTAELAHQYIGNHQDIHGYYKYPIKTNTFSRSNPEFDELFEKVPFLTYDIPKYHMSDFPQDRILYSAIFDGYAKDLLDCTILKEFKLYWIIYVLSQNLKNLFLKKMKI